MADQPASVPWLAVVVVVGLALVALAAWQPTWRRPILGAVVAVIALYVAFLIVVLAALGAMDAGSGASPLAFVAALVVAIGGLAVAYRIGRSGRPADRA